MRDEKNHLKYLTIAPADEDWGLVVTTAGHQQIHPKGNYPLAKHPESYDFKPQSGRILNEYQLVYITEGSGYFSSRSFRKKKVKAGTMFILFPGEWHNYHPDNETGWNEYWVGFRGNRIDQLMMNNRFFSMDEPLHRIGFSATIIGLYEDIIRFSIQEKAGYQQMISSIVFHILGALYYKEKNNSFNNTFTITKINEARLYMKENIRSTISPEIIAGELGLGYSWFRKMFKEYTGVSPVQYQLQLKIHRAKELLTSTQLSISEIAFELGFENAGQFSTFFKKKEGISPSAFRERMH